MALPFLLFLAGLIVLIWLLLWTRQRTALQRQPEAAAAPLEILPAQIASNEAVLLASAHGRLLFANEPARRLLKLDGEADLEWLASRARPSEQFLDLFSEPGRAAFQYEDRWLEGSSHQIPSGGELRMVVVLRALMPQAGEAPSDLLSLADAMSIIDEIGDTVIASLGVEQVVQALLTIVRKGMPADAGEINLWDEATQTLSPRGWVGDSIYVLALAEAGGLYSEEEGVTGYIAHEREPVLVHDSSQPDAVRPKLASSYQSFIGVPLVHADSFIGTLEFAADAPGSFGQSQLALLLAVSKQVATSIYNTQLYAEQQQRIIDLASLQNVQYDPADARSVEAAYSAMTERVARLLGAEMCGVLLYDERRHALLAQVPFHGLPTPIARSYSIPASPGGEMTRVLKSDSYWLSNELAEETLADRMGLSLLINAAGVYNIALVPLSVGTRPIGMLHVSNKPSHGGFTLRDVQNLKLLASQVVVLVEDIRLAAEGRRRESELLGVQELSQAVSSFTHEQEFYALANERIAKLMNVEMSGILLFDEESQQLVAQPPFYGIDSALISAYSIAVTPGGPIAQIWEEEDSWYTNNALADKVVLGAGLTELAALIGVNRTLMAAMETGGRRIGVIQVSNKHRDQDFTDQDARLLTIYASQIAGLIENTRLYREAQRRAQESDTLRALAEKASAINMPGDSFRPLFELVARVLNSEIVFASHIDATSGALVLLPENVYGRELTEAVIFEAYAPGFEYTVALAREPLLVTHAREDDAAPPVYQNLLGKLDADGVVIVPLVAGDQCYGELGVANRVRGAYSEDHVRTLQAVAVQVASALERMRLYEATGQNLSRRLLELDAISRVSNELAQTLDLDYVLDVIRVEALRATDAAGASVLLLKPAAEWTTPGQPEVDRRLGSELPAGVLLALEREAIAKAGEPVQVDDYGENSPDRSALSARSALAAAFVYEDRAIGVITVYSRRPSNFDDRAANFVMTLAAKASVGYANQLRFLEGQDRATRLRRRVEQLNQIFDLGQMLQHNVEPIMMMEAIAYSLQQACSYDIVVMTMVQDTDDGPVLRRVAQAGLPLDSFEASRARTMGFAALESLFNRDEFRLSESYFLPFERLRDWYEDGVEVFSTQAPGQRTLHPRSRDDWRDGDMLLVPITGADGQPLGVISVDRPTEDKRPDRSSVEVLEIFAHQAAATIENTRLYMASIKGQEQEARLNEVMEAIASTLDLNQIVEAVARGVLRLLPFARMVLVLPDLEQQGYDLIRVSVKPDSSLVVGRDRRASLQGTAIEAVLNGTGDLLAHIDFDNPSTYDDLRAAHAEGERTSLFLPLLAGGQRLGVMQIGSNLIEAYGFNEYRSLLQRIANLTAVAVQNARLFNQAVNLQLFNESVFQSIQQGILVLDRQSRIVTANSYLRQHLGWADDPAGEKLFEVHPALAESLRQPVQSVLETAQPRELFDMRFSLLDGRDSALLNVYMYALQGGGAVRGLVLVVDDVSERVQLEQAVAQRSSQLEALTEVSSRIAAVLRRDDVIKLAFDELGRILGYDAMTFWVRDGDQLSMEAARGFGLPLEPVFAPVDDLEQLRPAVEQAWLPPKAVDKAASPRRAGSWLGVPLVRQGQITAVITLARAAANAYDAQAQQTAMAFANQMAVALANAELFEETQSRTQRLSLLNRVSVALAQSLDIENILEVALREIAETLDVERATGYLFDRDANTASAVVEHPRGDFPPSKVIHINEAVVLQHVWRKATPLIVEDVSLVDDAGIRNELAENGVTAYVLLPMTVGGQSSGVFELEVFDGARRFEAEKIELALIIANQAAIAALNANLLEQTLVRTRELETLLEAAQATSISLDLGEVFQSVVRLTMQALNVDDCAIMMYDNVEETLVVEMDVNRMGDDTRVMPEGTEFDLFQYAAKTRGLRDGHVAIVRIDDPQADKRELEEMRQTGDAQRMLVPLMVRESAIGMIQVELTDPHRSFTHREVRMAQALGAQAATAIENARLSTEAASQVEQSLIINDLSRAISSTMDIQQMIGIVREQVPPLTGTSEIYLALYDAQTSDIVFPLAMRNGRDFEIPPRKLMNDEVSFVIRRRSPLMLGGDNPSPDEVRRNLQIINNEGDSTRYLGVPLIAGDQVVGVLAVRDSETMHAFGLNDQRILTTIGAQLGATIQNANLFERIRGFANELNQRVQERTAELQGERDRLDALYRLTSELGRTLDLTRILEVSLEQASQAVAAEEAVVLMIDPLHDQLVARALRRASGETIIRTAPLNANDTEELPNAALAAHPAGQIASSLIRRGENAETIPDLRRASDWNAKAYGAAEWRSALAVLLETNEDVQGALVFLSAQPNAFGEAQLRLVTAAASQVSAAINNADLYNLIRDQADRMAVLLRAEQEEAEKNSAILEGIGDGVLLADASGVVVLFNAAAEQILAVPRAAALHQSLEDVSERFPQSAPWIAPIAGWASSERAAPGGGLEIDRVELGERIINLRASPVFNGDQYLGVVSLFRDITRDVEVDRMKSEFISNVSHELRTPMTSIKGYAELLLMGGAGQVSNEQQQFLTTIKYNADRLGHLVDDLLDISRIESGGEDLKLEPIAVAPLLDDVVLTLKSRPDFERKGLTLTLTVAPDLPDLVADPTKVKQILDNIADNAFSYTPQGGRISLDVALEAQKNGGAPRMLFTIRDSGIGIPEEFRDRVWNRFERYEEAALVMDVPGTGLGLAIVRTLVEQHRGEVWFDTVEGKGTTFYVALPVGGPDVAGKKVDTGKLKDAQY